MIACGAAACDCVGIITSPGLKPNGTAVADDTPLCPHHVTAGTPTAMWTPAGPPGAAVRSLLPLGNGVLLVGTGLGQARGVMTTRAAGIFRSTDNGATVTKVLTLPAGSVESMVEAQGAIYAGATEDGPPSMLPDGGMPATAGTLFASTDNGVSFQDASQGLAAGSVVLWLSVASGTPARVYALVSDTTDVTTLYRKDGTADWALQDGMGIDPTEGGPLTGIAAHPSQRDRVFAVDGAHVYKSENGGQLFTVVADKPFGPPSGLADTGAMTMTATSLIITTTTNGVFVSTDEGVTLTEKLAGPLGTYPSVLAALQTPSGVLVGTDGSGLMAPDLKTPVAKCLLDSVVVSIARAPDAPTVWVGTNGGLQLSTDDAANFTTAGLGLDELLGRFTVATIGTEPTVFLMSSAGLYRFSVASGQWQRQGDWAKTIGFSDVAVSADGTFAFVSVDETYFPGRYGVSGSVWFWDLVAHKVSQLSGIQANVGAVAADPRQAGRAFAYQRAGDDDAMTAITGVLVRSQNAAGFSASMITTDSISASSDFRFSPLAVATDGTIYAGGKLADGSPVLLRSDDSGATKMQVWNTPGWIAYGVYVEPETGNVLLTGQLGTVGIRRSTDKGMTFAEYDDGLTGFGLFVYSLAFAPGGALLVGTEAGPQLATDGKTFTPLTDGFAVPPAVWSIAVLPGTPAIALASTSQGMYWRTLP